MMIPAQRMNYECQYFSHDTKTIAESINELFDNAFRYKQRDINWTALAVQIIIQLIAKHKRQNYFSRAIISLIR